MMCLVFPTPFERDLQRFSTAYLHLVSGRKRVVLHIQEANQDHGPQPRKEPPDSTDICYDHQNDRENQHCISPLGPLQDQAAVLTQLGHVLLTAVEPDAAVVAEGLQLQQLLRLVLLPKPFHYQARAAHGGDGPLEVVVLLVYILLLLRRELLPPLLGLRGVGLVVQAPVDLGLAFFIHTALPFLCSVGTGRACPICLRAGAGPANVTVISLPAAGKLPALGTERLSTLF